MSKILFLIRHGELPAEYAHRYIGRLDPGLSSDGMAACESLRQLSCDCVVSSPMRRAMETAQWIKAPIQTDDRLREIDFGDWDGKTFAEISALASPEQLRIWAECPEQMSFPGGESVPDFHNRVDEVFQHLALLAASRVAVVTHGGCLMRILAVIRQLPPAKQFECLPPRGSVVTIVRQKGMWYEQSIDSGDRRCQIR